MYRKSVGQGAKLARMGHTLCENRHRLIVNITVTQADGTAKRAAAIEMLDVLNEKPDVKSKSVGADRGYDSGEFFQALEGRGIAPHVPLVKDPRHPATVTDMK